jgi:hypothetical protein
VRTRSIKEKIVHFHSEKKIDKKRKMVNSTVSKRSTNRENKSIPQLGEDQQKEKIGHFHSEKKIDKSEKWAFPQ